MRASVVPWAVPILAMGIGCDSVAPDPGSAAGAEDSTSDGANPNSGSSGLLPESTLTDEFEGAVFRCDPTSGQESETGIFFAIGSMNRKLAVYPEFAAYAGLSSVTTCPQAIAYAQAYDQYSLSNPGFDKDSPANGLAQSQARTARLKIVGGIRPIAYDFPSQPTPIVRIEQVEWGDNSRQQVVNEYCGRVYACTGTFINKHFILTAAHCLQPAGIGRAQFTNGVCPALPEDPDPATLPSGGDAYWIIRWAADPTVRGSDPQFPENKFEYSTAEPTGPRSPSQTLRLRQFPHPTWSGGATDSSQVDVALLMALFWSLPDNQLPPDVSTGGAMKLRAAGQSHSQNYRFAGYGPNSPTDIYSSEGILREAPAPANLSWDQGDHRVHNTVQAGQPRLCVGDSGGPLFFRLSGGYDQYGQSVVTAVASSIRSNEACAIVGLDQQWARADEKGVVEWIAKTLRQNYGDSFACKPEDNGANLRCWGDPCYKDSDCKHLGAGYRCTSSGAMLKNCPSQLCPSENENPCGCIKGQCIKNPRYPGTVSP